MAKKKQTGDQESSKPERTQIIVRSTKTRANQRISASAFTGQYDVFIDLDGKIDVVSTSDSTIRVLYAGGYKFINGVWTEYSTVNAAQTIALESIMSKFDNYKIMYK